MASIQDTKDYTRKRAVIETNKGNITLKFFPDVAPGHVKNFCDLAEKGYYNGVIFHRVIKGFMIQGGDPTGTGTGGPGYKIKAEFNNKPHVKGTVSMARSADPDSAGSQFFICFDKAPHLDGKYTAFAKVISGMDVLEKLEKVPVGGRGGSTPQTPVVLESVTILPRSEWKPASK